MQHTVVEIDGWRVESWELARDACCASQDAKLVWACDDKLRLAALDGVTPTPRTPMYAGVDGAMWATSVLRVALQNPIGSLADCALAANAALYDIDVASSRDQAQACVVAADLQVDGSAVLLRAGDCEAWTATGRAWEPVFAADARTTDAARLLACWAAEHPDASSDERHQIEEDLFGRTSAWNSTAVGRFPRPAIDLARLAGCDRLVLASDGAALNATALLDLPGWLAGLANASDHPARPPAPNVTTM